MVVVKKKITTWNSFEKQIKPCLVLSLKTSIWDLTKRQIPWSLISNIKKATQGNGKKYKIGTRIKIIQVF